MAQGFGISLVGSIINSILIFIGGIVLVIVTPFIAVAQLRIHQSIIERRVQAEASRQQKQAKKAHLKAIETFDVESGKQQKARKADLSKHELIKRLDSIDQSILVLATETDANNRTMALQDAHSEMMTLAASLATGVITRDALQDPEIRELATETCKDLTRLGLSEDRLCRDLKRIFKLRSK